LILKEFKTQLDELISKSQISEIEYNHFLKRGIQYEKFGKKYPKLREIFPEGMPIGASKKFIQELEIPYQETSFVCSLATKSSPKVYIYKKTPESGQIKDLLAGKRPVGDNIFAALNRILLGDKAVLISADNLIENKEQIWDWRFFGKNLIKKYPEVYKELKDFSEKKSGSKITQVVIARKKETFRRLNILKKSNNKEIAILNDQNTKVIFLTNDEGKEIINKIKSDNVSHISKSNQRGEIDIIQCLKELKKRFNVPMMLNDGGRIMSDGLKREKLLGGERITYESFPGEKYAPKKIQNAMILGKEGQGKDNSELKDAVVVFSKKLNIEGPETFKLHLYPMV